MHQSVSARRCRTSPTTRSGNCCDCAREPGLAGVRRRSRDGDERCVRCLNRQALEPLAEQRVEVVESLRVRRDVGCDLGDEGGVFAGSGAVREDVLPHAASLRTIKRKAAGSSRVGSVERYVTKSQIMPTRALTNLWPRGYSR